MLGEELSVWSRCGSRSRRSCPAAELRESVDAVSDMVPPPGADGGAETGGPRLTERIATVTPFLKMLTEVIAFGCHPRGRAGAGGDAGPAAPAGPPHARSPAADIDHGLVSGPWKPLVFAEATGGAVDRNAYVFCVLAAVLTGTSSAARSTPGPRPAGATRRPQLLAGEAVGAVRRDRC